MPTFEVTQSHGWYEAACPKLGVTITARRIEDIEVTARRTAARVFGANAAVALVMTKKPTVLDRLAGFFTRPNRVGHS